MFQALSCGGGEADATSWAGLDLGVRVTARVTAVSLLTTLPRTRPDAFRYLRYLSPVAGFGNLAEVQFHAR
jgi:hypothetical protein